MKRGLLLDLDGTLCDSLPGLRRAYDEFLASFGSTGSDAEFERLNGATLAGIVRALQSAHELAGAREALEFRYAQGMEAARRAALPMRGTRELLAAAQCGGWRVAIVTSGGHRDAERWLEAHGLGASVEVVVGADDDVAPKPSPEPYRRALDGLGCPAAASIAVEDSEAGLRGALAAGLETFHLQPLERVSTVRGHGPEPLAAATRIAKLDELIPRLERSR